MNKMTIETANIFIVPTGNRKAVLLELITDQGLRGIGEAGVAYGVGGESAAQMLREMVERFVIGQNASGITAIWQEIYDRSFWTRNGGAISYSALSAIEQALWDIKGKQLDAPVYELLGGCLWDDLEVYANGWWIGCDTPDEYASAAAAIVARGYRGIKFYPLGLADPVIVVRHPSRRQLDARKLPLVCDRVAAVREAVGPDIDIMLDFGGGLATDQVLRICRRIEPFDILFIEEAVDPASIDALTAVAAGTGITLAAGERAYGRPGCQRLLDSGAVDVLQPDVCNSGGLLEARLIAGMAEHSNARIAPHNYGSHLATAVAVQFAAMIPNFMVLEVFPDFEREPGYLAVLEQPLEGRLEGGKMPIPQGAGLGVTLDLEAIGPWHYARCQVD
jgi:galactonate dehydratase